MTLLAPITNRAAELGPSAFPWWKDWRGQAVAIVASGPSAKSSGVEKLKGRLPLLAIKENAVDLCPWADVVYGCDRAWWQHRRGLPGSSALKLTYSDVGASQFPDVHQIKIRDKGLDQIIVDEPGVIGSGGNSGFQSLNLVLQFGATRVLGIGFDMHDRSGVHWYGRNNWAHANNPADTNFRRWIKAFDGAADTLRRLGVEFLNAAPYSALRAYPKIGVEDALSRWGL